MDADEVVAMMEQGVDVASLSKENGGVDAGMSLRQRYRRTMFFQQVDVLPNFEFGYWQETLSGWHKQGLPIDIDNEKKAYEYFGIENWQTAPIRSMGLIPAFEYEVLSENEKNIKYRDPEGFIAEINKEGHKSIPHYIDFPIKNREDWDEFKQRLQPDPLRMPANWKELAAAYNNRDYPLAIFFGSLIGTPRNWIGFEDICYMVHDEPELLEDIVEHLCNLTIQTIEPALKDVEFDFASGWEDICFNSGPIVGVDFMRNIVAPRYKRITDLLAKHGCTIVWTDCDGDIKPIVDCLLAGGINCMFPVEVHGGSDPVELRRRWPGIRLQGGFCKMILTDSKKSIETEMKRLRPLVQEGGFLPGIDHRVQADVPLENYKYYLKLKRNLLGAGGKPQYDETTV